MAIVKCKTCGTEIDDEVLKCPKCDSLGPKRGKRIRWIMLGVLAGVLILFGWGLYLRMNEPEKPYEEVLKERLDDKLSQRGIAAVLLLKSHLNNPDSMQLKTALSNEDGSVLCFEYSEKDADGRVKQAKSVYVDGEPSKHDNAWKLFCGKKNVHPIKVN